MKNLIFLSLTALMLNTACSNVTFTGGESNKSCQIETYSKEDLQRIKHSEFDGLSDDKINEFALALLPCVGDPDPEIRDGIVYESLSYLLRNEKLTDVTKNDLITSMTGMLDGPGVKGGYLKPFAALDLSELVRADRISPYLTNFQRAELIAATVEYLSSIKDYRGYNDEEGWRHGVAHASDLTLQFVLNDQIIEPQLRALRGAIAVQISPRNVHAYIHGESERLARPILYMARRGTFSQDDWAAWFAGVGDPAPFDDWNAVSKSEAGLAKLHNTRDFLNAIYVNASVSQNENVKALQNSALNIMKQLP